jgi:putative transposase
MHSIVLYLIPPSYLGRIIGAFKSIINNNYIAGVKAQNWQPFDKRLLQRNYYEHIIRDDLGLQKIRAYIQNNPATWQTDSLHPGMESQ